MGKNSLTMIIRCHSIEWFRFVKIVAIILRKSGVTLEKYMAVRHFLFKPPLSLNLNGDFIRHFIYTFVSQRWYTHTSHFFLLMLGYYIKI